MVGTGSEMNGGAVITNHKQKLKIGHVFGDNVFPKFAVLNPTFTYTLPKYQMVAGIYDIFNHITEQYFSGTDDNTSDYIAEGLMKSLIHASRIAAANPTDYEARSNIMWTATWALNTLIAKGKSTDWMVHMIGQWPITAISALTDLKNSCDSQQMYGRLTKTENQTSRLPKKDCYVWRRGCVSSVSL